jgi:hypothetical protein
LLGFQNGRSHRGPRAVKMVTCPFLLTASSLPQDPQKSLRCHTALPPPELSLLAWLLLTLCRNGESHPVPYPCPCATPCHEDPLVHHLPPSHSELCGNYSSCFPRRYTGVGVLITLSLLEVKAHQARAGVQLSGRAWRPTRVRSCFHLQHCKNNKTQTQLCETPHGDPPSRSLPLTVHVGQPYTIRCPHIQSHSEHLSSESILIVHHSHSVPTPNPQTCRQLSCRAKHLGKTPPPYCTAFILCVHHTG